MSQELYLIRMAVNLRAAIEEARVAFGGRPAAIADEGLVVKTALSTVFGAEAPKPWTIVERPQVGQGRDSFVLSAYSALAPDALRFHAFQRRVEGQSIVDPESISGIPVPIFDAGRWLDAWVTYCPTARVRSDDPRLATRSAERRSRNTHERDVFLLALGERLPPGTPLPPREEAVEREEVYLDFLERRLGDAASVVRDGPRRVASIRGLRRRLMVRPCEPGYGRQSQLFDGPARGRPRQIQSFELPEATAQAVIEVKDADAFRSLLGSGVGRHNRYGFGMLALRPSSGGALGSFRGVVAPV
jgi:hypothetical protein